MAEKFCHHLASSTPNEGFFNMPQICEMGPKASPLKEGVLKIFLP
jgi:hypothetical protein